MHIEPTQLINDIQEANELERLGETGHVIQRNSSLIITSVHGFSHEREGAIKVPDEGSFVFSYLLAKYLNANWAAVGIPLLKDSNYYRDTEFKNEVLKHFGASVEVAVDIHACHALRAFDVEVGTAYRKESSSDLTFVDTLSARGYYCVINEIFKAKGNGVSQTMTDFWHNHGKTAIQLEISSCYLTGDSRMEWHQRAKLLHFLICAIDLYAQTHQSG